MITLRAAVMQIVRSLGIAAAIALVTFTGTRLPVNATTVAFAYLLTVVVTATLGPLFEAIFASVASAICLNFFFLPPLYRLSISSSEDWAALFAFSVTAVIVSQLSSTAKAQTAAAVDRGREMERLYTLSRATLLNTLPESAAREAVVQIARIFDFSSVSLFERATERIYRAGPVDLPDWDARLRMAALNGTVSEDRETSTIATSVRLGADVIGSLVLRGEALSDSALQALSNLVAIALERARMLEATNAADLIRKSEELKSTLLDAIAHEFKTPLTSVKAAASTLRSGVADPQARQELIEIVDEEADRLERLVTGAIQMARIEAGEMRLERRDFLVSSLVANALESLSGLMDGRTVEQRIPPDLHAHADPELLLLALKQVVDNALKYSPAGSAIGVNSQQQDEGVKITVSNSGPGIPEGEHRRIFDRYYRSPHTRDRIPGTGIGLAIAREIMLAHGGQIWAESQRGEGSEISLLLPSIPPGPPA